MARVNVDLTITNIDKILEKKSPNAIYFNSWGFSKKSIRESLSEVIATVKEKNYTQVSLVMRPYLFGNRIRYVEKVLKEELPQVKVNTQIKN